MPPRSAVAQLPEAIRAELDQWLIHRGFSGYEELSEWLAGKGFSISKSALHRYGSAFEERTEKLRAATRMAETLAAAVGDDAGAMNDALIRLTQGELFEVFLRAETEGKDLMDLLPEISLAVARLTRSSVQQKKWQTEFRAKAEKKLTALEKEASGKKGGLDLATLQRVREEVYGIL